jgi:phospholipid/cholesterol/gamma-HCH transport system substrate-binding protein
MAIPFRVRWAEWVAGVFVLATFAAVLGALVMLTSARGTFGGDVTFEVSLSDGHGIAPGGVVKMLGLPIGSIESVEITEDNRVRATLQVDAEFADRVRTDSVARIEASFGLEGMLAGVGFVISPGSAEAEPLSSGDTLQATEPNNISELLPGVVDDPLFADAQALLHNLRTLSDELADDKSDIRRMLKSAAAILEMVEKGDGTVGRILRDEGELYTRMLATMDEVDATLGRAQTTMTRSGKLVTQASSMMDDADGVLKSADTMTTTATGVFEKMNPVFDDAGDAMKNLDAAVVEFAKTTERLGKLIGQMDEVVADMATVTAAAKKVWPIRRHIRREDK